MAITAITVIEASTGQLKLKLELEQKAP